MLASLKNDPYVRYEAPRSVRNDVSHKVPALDQSFSIENNPIKHGFSIASSTTPQGLQVAFRGTRTIARPPPWKYMTSACDSTSSELASNTCSHEGQISRPHNP